jgi:DNA (cytosine-5)-methyltransferase 1
MTIKVIDLFSGPGGLGEGFAAIEDGKAFGISVSAEMETSAHCTLTLRAFFRLAVKNGDRKAKTAYYDFCNLPSASHPSDRCPALWILAQDEARKLTLGDTASNQQLDSILDKLKVRDERCVLIGGPPCQAYSLVGRARNKGTSSYVPSADHRHFLYREYLRILANTRPAVFVMENVKGILSASVDGRKIFHEILTDLHDPVKAINFKAGPKYNIYSLTTSTKFQEGMEPSDINVRDFVIRSEEYGIPQARHRVILLGIREDMPQEDIPLLSVSKRASVRDAIGQLPELRSRLSRDDSPMAWRDKVINLGRSLHKDAEKKNLQHIASRMEAVTREIKINLAEGALRVEKKIILCGNEIKSQYEKWVQDKNVKVWLNHEARSHMDTDLARYLYASVFAEVNQRSPKGHLEFPLKGLAPAHANWESGKFSDRFRVQRFDAPSSTVTSHISKDGHYFIHPDPTQCRSLTVREAARLQSFPDNYFFQGTRTQQYHQVGNAVPPLLAYQIAEVVLSVFRG